MKPAHGENWKKSEAPIWVTRWDFVVGAFVASGLPVGRTEQ
jgi:hypothetical protein